MKRPLVLGAALLVIATVAVAWVFAVPALPERRGGLPTARVTRGPLALNVHATGELRAGRTVTMVTPPVGGMLRIVQLVPTGGAVKAGDVVMEFDPADQLYNLEQARTDLAEAQQEIVKMKADREVQAAQDDVDLLTARYDVRRAELDVMNNEFISAIDAEKNALSLEEAKRRLAQLEQDVKSRSVTNQAAMQVVEEKRNKAELAMQRAQQIIDGLVLKAPIDGVVSVKENRDAAGGFFFWGMTLPEYREGDSVGGGRQVVDIIEAGKMEVRARIEETERDNLAEGQQADVTVDTLPGHTFKAKVGALAGNASRGDFFEPSASVTRLFDITFQFEAQDPRLKAGASAKVLVHGRELESVLHVPRQAVFEKAGKTHVFVRNGDGFEQREVKVVRRTESRMVLEGIDEGVEIALIDPNAAAKLSGPASAGPLPSGPAK